MIISKLIQQSTYRQGELNHIRLTQGYFLESLPNPVRGKPKLLPMKLSTFPNSANKIIKNALKTQEKLFFRNKNPRLIMAPFFST